MKGEERIGGRRKSGACIRLTMLASLWMKFQKVAERVNSRYISAQIGMEKDIQRKKS